MKDKLTEANLKKIISEEMNNAIDEAATDAVKRIINGVKKIALFWRASKKEEGYADYELDQAVSELVQNIIRSFAEINKKVTKGQFPGVEKSRSSERGEVPLGALEEKVSDLKLENVLVVDPLYPALSYILDRARDVDRSRRAQRDQQMLVDRQLILVVRIAAEVAAEPVRERRRDARDRLAVAAAAQRGTTAARVVRDHQRNSLVLRTGPECGLS